MTDNDAEITLLEIASAQPLENPQSGKCSVVWPAAFFALLCMWGQGGRRERGRGSHFTRYGINESFTLQEFHLIRDHPQMTSDDILTL